MLTAITSTNEKYVIFCILNWFCSSENTFAMKSHLLLKRELSLSFVGEPEKQRQALGRELTETYVGELKRLICGKRSDEAGLHLFSEKRTTIPKIHPELTFSFEVCECVYVNEERKRICSFACPPALRR